MSYRLKAALKASIAPEIGPPPSFTRALAAYFNDNEGLTWLAPVNCARFGGARFERNLLGGPTEDFTNAYWSVGDASNPKIPNSTDIAAPNGTFTACKWTLNQIAGVNRSFGCAGITLPYSVAGRTFVFSFWVYVPSTNTGTLTSYMYSTGEIPGDGLNLNTLPRDQWVRVRYKHTYTVAAKSIVPQFHGNFGDTLGNTIYVWRPSVNDVTGRANDAPPEYIPVQRAGVAAPYYGAGADGCQFFDYLNGNTVTNNVVTEAKGAAIPLATLKRFRKEKAATNLFKNSLFVGSTSTAAPTSWSLVAGGGTIAEVPSTLSQAGEVAIRLAATAARQFIYQVVALAANTSYTLSFLVESVDVPIRNDFFLNFNGLAADAVIDWGTLGAGTNNITPGWHHMTLNVVTASPTVQLRMGIGTPNTSTGDVTFSHPQLETGKLLTSFIATPATVVATRPEDLLVYPVSVFSDGEGTAFAGAESDDWTQNNNVRVIGAGLVNEPGTALFASGSRFGTYDVTVPALSGTATFSGRMFGAATWSSRTGLKRAFVNGVAGNTNAYDGSYNLSGVGIGMGGSLPFQGYIGDVVILDNALDPLDVPSLPDYQYPRLLDTALVGQVASVSVSGAVAQPSVSGALAAPQITGAVPQVAIAGAVSNPTIQGSV